MTAVYCCNHVKHVNMLQAKCKSRNMSWTGHVVLAGEREYVHGFGWKIGMKAKAWNT
jgi:hypothetical protein